MRSFLTFVLFSFTILFMVHFSTADLPSILTSDPCYIENTDCSSCSRNTTCVWCPNSDSDSNPSYCMRGDWLGPNEPGVTCNGWRWKQCKLTGVTLLIIFGGIIGGVALVLLLTCIFCCFCRKCRKVFSSRDRKRDYEMQQEIGLLAERADSLRRKHSEREDSYEKKREEIRSKYSK